MIDTWVFASVSSVSCLQSLTDRFQLWRDRDQIKKLLFDWFLATESTNFVCENLFQALRCVQQTTERITTTMTSPEQSWVFTAAMWHYNVTKTFCTLTLLDEDRFLTAAAAVACECDLLSVCVVPCTGATALVTWSAGSDSGTVCRVVLIVADIALLLMLLVLFLLIPLLPLTTASAGMGGTAAILTSVTLTCFAVYSYVENS